MLFFLNSCVDARKTFFCHFLLMTPARKDICLFLLFVFLSKEYLLSARYKVNKTDMVLAFLTYWLDERREKGERRVV